MSPARIGIIGGGYAGLTAAYELQKKGHVVTVLEKYGRWGGQAATLPLLGTHIEHFYHHLFGSDAHVLGLMDELQVNLAGKVKRLREARGLSQQRMADLAGIPRPTWASLESGAANPTLSVLSRAAEALQVSIEELVGPPRTAAA